MVRIRVEPLHFHQLTNLVETKQKHVVEENECAIYELLTRVKVDGFVLSMFLCEN